MEKIIEILKYLYQQSFGVFGPPTIITGTSPIPCQGTSFQAVSDDVIIASIIINGVEITAFNDVTLAQGQVMYGNITSVTLTSGKGIVYSGRNL